MEKEQKPSTTMECIASLSRLNCQIHNFSFLSFPFHCLVREPALAGRPGLDYKHRIRVYPAPQAAFRSAGTVLWLFLVSCK